MRLPQTFANALSATQMAEYGRDKDRLFRMTSQASSYVLLGALPIGWSQLARSKQYLRGSCKLLRKIAYQEMPHISQKISGFHHGLLALSVGSGPVSSPQKPRVPNSGQPQHATRRSGHHGKASPAMRNGSNPKSRPAASLATVTSRSCRSRNPVLSAASAREYHYGARK